jgi:regulator of protease activity HflC (stomatin/prohibitin superfamily)
VPGIAGIVVIIIVALYIINSIKILSEYERGVIFRLGRLLETPKGPGIILVFAPIDRIVRVSICGRRRWTCRRRTSSPATT